LKFSIYTSRFLFSSTLCSIAFGVCLSAFAQTTPTEAERQKALSVQYPINALSAAELSAPLIIAKQGSFFMGGHDEYSDSLSNLPAYGSSGTITLGQMYVSYQIPVNRKPFSLVLIHGCCLTGKTWESTPDERMGWSEYFVRRGFSTFVIDQVGRGRSAVNATAINEIGRASKSDPNQLVTDKPQVFAASHEDAWKIFRFGPEMPKVYPDLQFPIQAQGALWQQMVPDWLFSLPKPNPTEVALSQLSKTLKTTILMSHSQSGIFPFNTAGISKEGISSIIAVEPGACPAESSDLEPFKGYPILVLFGDYVELSTRWAPRLKACKAFAEKLNLAGGDAQVLVLPEMGIKGNSHMLMQDLNNIQIADLLATWIENHVH
jgi:pimeloyl-ACP methyl ester carboxylesterase